MMPSHARGHENKPVFADPEIGRNSIQRTIPFLLDRPRPAAVRAGLETLMIWAPWMAQGR